MWFVNRRVGQKLLSCKDQGQTRTSRLCFVPRLEILESRTMLSTFTVLNLADSGDGSLRAAIAAAEANPGPDQINFAPGVNGTITLTSGELHITTDMTITGPGTDMLTVSGNHTSRVFNVLGGADASSAIVVNISNISVSDGFASRGGGVENLGFSMLTLAGVLVSHNRAGHLGGGIFNFGPAAASLVVSDSLIIGNIVQGNIGEGGGICSIGKSVTIAHSVVSGNQAIGTVLSGDGAGILSVLGTLTVTNSTISDNLAAGGPGNLSFAGGIEVALGTASLSYSTISRNQAIGGTEGGFGFGGGVFTEFATGDIRSCDITDNLASGGDGGSIGGGALGGGIWSGGPLSVSDSLLMGNRAVGGSDGSGGSNDSEVGTALGGAIFNNPTFRLEIHDSVLRGNQAIGGNNAISIAPNRAEAGAAVGGAIYNSFGGQVIIRGSIIEHNQAIAGNGNTANGPTAFAGTAIGGGINNVFDGDAFGLGPTQASFLDCTIQDNDAIGGNGNTASGSMPFAGAGLGGGIANSFGASTDITDSAISNNRAIGGEGNLSNSGAALANLGAGGAIFNALGNFQFDTGEVLAPSIVTVTNSTLEYNQAKGGDGGLDTPAGDGWGGAIADLFMATTSVTGSTIADNLALGGEGTGGGNGFGGGAYNDDSSSLTLQTSTVTGNHANGGDVTGGTATGQGIGGGIYNLGSFFLDALTIVRFNHASTSNDDIFGPFVII